MRKQKQYYIYITINRVNGKIYVGQHYGYLNDSYIGSGVRFLRAVRKYGWESFSKRIICICAETEVDALEIRYVKEYHAQDPKIGYNTTEGGDSPVWRGRKWSDISTPRKYQKRLAKKKARDAAYWTEETRARLGEAVKAKQWTGEKGEARRKRFSEMYVGRNNPSVRAYKVITPCETFIVLDGLRKFCEEHDIVWDTVRRFVNKGVIGRSGPKDTSLFREKGGHYKGTKQKILGWQIIEIDKEEALQYELHNIEGH